MFALSVISILISSYLILSVSDKKFQFKNNIGFIIFILIAFSQMIISFEVLSVFKLITRNNFLIINFIFLISSIFLWLKNKRYVYKTGFKEEFKKIIKALKCDKILMFIGICFIIFFISKLFYALFFPVNYGDAIHYYFSRCTMWVQNASLNHFITYDSRELIMPVNAELSYLWLFLFTKNELGAGIFPFIFYVNAIIVIYNFLGELGFARRKRLWSIFLFSSFALVFVECAIPGSDLWAASLMITCFYLFFCACKNNKKNLIFFSALSYALAAGVKTTSLIAIPASGIILIIISLLYSKKETKKNILYFIGYFIVNFIIFSSYNYILNLIEFHNPLSDSSQLLINSFRGGLKGYLFNIISYAFSIFDYSGMPDFFNIGEHIQNLQDKIFAFICITPEIYSSEYFDQRFIYNSQIYLMNSLLGISGMLTFYPALIYSFYMLFKNKKSKKAILLASLSLFYFLNIIIFSRVMLFTQYNMRYLLTFIIPASLIIVYTYIKSNRNLYKIILTLFLFIILALMTHSKPIAYIIKYAQYKSIPIEQRQTHKHFMLNDCDELNILKYMLNQKRSNIGLLVYADKTCPIYYIYKLRLFNHNVEVILPEIITKYDLSKYDYIITSKDFIDSTVIKNFKKDAPVLNKAMCVYADYKGKIIIPENTSSTPIVVSCQVPYDYIFDNGFYIMENPAFDKYYILKNKFLIH